jgi:hypothetical protein
MDILHFFNERPHFTFLSVTFTVSVGHSEFKASMGWIDKFKSRNGISHKVLSGESAAVSYIDCDYWRKEILPQLIQNYDPRDITLLDCVMGGMKSPQEQYQTVLKRLEVQR